MHILNILFSEYYIYIYFYSLYVTKPDYIELSKTPTFFIRGTTIPGSSRSFWIVWGSSGYIYSGGGVLYMRVVHERTGFFASRLI